MNEYEPCGWNQTQPVRLPVELQVHVALETRGGTAAQYYNDTTVVWLEIENVDFLKVFLVVFFIVNIITVCGLG